MWDQGHPHALPPEYDPVLWKTLAFHIEFSKMKVSLEFTYALYIFNTKLRMYGGNRNTKTLDLIRTWMAFKH